MTKIAPLNLTDWIPPLAGVEISWKLCVCAMCIQAVYQECLWTYCK